jgi:TetR/AcrR family transcriptional repressor of nem operon
LAAVARTGRPRSFDEDATVARALDFFWSRGFGATSIQDLVDTLEVERGRLYATFGGKRLFYLDTVKLYWAEYEKRLITALAATPCCPRCARYSCCPLS